MRRSPLAIALYSIVLLALIGTTTAFVRMDKTITVSIDGQLRHVQTFAGSVGGALDRAGIDVGAHDLVAPDLSAPIRDHGLVVIRRGRLVNLTLDGRTRPVWVTAMSVDEVLGQLDLRAGTMYLSASRDQSIPLSGFSLTVRLPQRVNILVDNRVVSATTIAPTVSALLSQVHIRLARTDQLSVPGTLYPTTGLVIRVTRIRYGRERVDEAIPYATIQRDDSSLWSGDTQVAQYGQPGVRVLVYALVSRDHRIVSRRLVSNQVGAQPQTEIIDIGTKPAPASSLNWSALASCESGGNPGSVSADGQYYGLYQFSLPTWYSVGGSGYPNQASSAEQTYRAELLFDADGTSPWPVCGHYLYS